MEIQRVPKSMCFFMVTVCLTHYTQVTAKVNSDYEQYFAVFVEDKKGGYAVHSRVESSGKVTSSQEICITIRRSRLPMRMEAKESCVETTTGEPISFKTKSRLGSVITRVSGRVDRNGAVSGTMRSFGNRQALTGHLQQGAVMSEGLRLLKLKEGLEEGVRYEVIMFLPQVLLSVPAQIRVGPRQNIDLLGRVVAATEITTTYSLPGTGQIVSTSYVDENLRLLKHITPFEGITIEMVACAEEFAKGRRDVVELIDKMFLQSPRPLENLGEVKSITYYLSPTRSVPRLVIPFCDNQTVHESEDGKMIVTVDSITIPTDANFPYEGTDEAILEAMKPTRFLQSDHELVVDLAKRAVGDTKDAAEAAGKIEKFVADYIENRSLSVGYASAAEVAASKQGDCSEFAVLAAAMCRAVGIPAKVVVGVAYVNDFAGQKGFRAHVWMQAHVGNKWVGFDPAFKATGLDRDGVGHIVLAIGDGEPRDFFKLENTLSRIKIEEILVNKK